MLPRRLLPLALAAFVATAAPARAGGPPPLEGGVTCTQELKGQYPLAKVKRRGLPIEITCDGPARFFAMPQFAAMTKADQDLTEAAPNGTPNIARVEPTGMDEAGTKTVRPRFTKLALKIMSRYKRTRLLVGLATMREDGSYWSEPGDWSRTIVIR